MTRGVRGAPAVRAAAIVAGLASTLAGCPPRPVTTDGGGPGSDAAGPGSDAAGPGSDAAGPGTDAAAGVNVPAPSPTYLDLIESEPNDTPETADDGGTLEDFGGGFYYWGTNFVGMPTTLGGTDEVDYFSFALPGTTATTVTFPVNPCWTAGPDLVDAWVYEVAPGAPLVEVWSSVTPDTTCEGSASVMLPGGTRYLLELRVPNLATVPAPMEYFW